MDMYRLCIVTFLHVMVLLVKEIESVQRCEKGTLYEGGNDGSYYVCMDKLTKEDAVQVCNVSESKLIADAQFEASDYMQNLFIDINKQWNNTWSAWIKDINIFRHMGELMQQCGYKYIDTTHNKNSISFTWDNCSFLHHAICLCDDKCAQELQDDLPNTSPTTTGSETNEHTMQSSTSMGEPFPLMAGIIIGIVLVIIVVIIITVIVVVTVRKRKQGTTSVNNTIYYTRNDLIRIAHKDLNQPSTSDQGEGQTESTIYAQSRKSET